MSHDAHVVIVDDDAAYLELLTLAVQEFVDTRISEYRSPKAAFAALCDGGFPDAVLLDLHMPELPGDQMASLLRAHGCSSVIVIVSAAISGTEHEECLQAGADAVVVKPNSFVELGRALQQALCEAGSRRLRRSRTT